MRKFYIYIGTATDVTEAEELLVSLAESNDGSELLANAEPLFLSDEEISNACCGS